MHSADRSVKAGSRIGRPIAFPSFGKQIKMRLLRRILLHYPLVLAFASSTLLSILFTKPCGLPFSGYSFDFYIFKYKNIDFKADLLYKISFLFNAFMRKYASDNYKSRPIISVFFMNSPAAKFEFHKNSR
jgi:hypothetical protein